MHLSIDVGMNVHAIRITTKEVSDSEAMDTMSADAFALEMNSRVPTTGTRTHQANPSHW